MPDPITAAQEHLPGIPEYSGGGGMPSLPTLTPNSPYQSLSLPQVTPRQADLPEERPQQNLGAVSKGGAIAFLADKVLRGAVQGYDMSRLRHADQFNKKMQSLQSLDQSLSDQYRQAYNQVGSTPKADGSLPTPEEIAADPTVKQLHNQLLVTHQATLDAIQGYMPQLSGDKGKSKKKSLMERLGDHSDPNEQLRAYYQVAQQLGPQAFYQVATPQQLKAMYDQRSAQGATTSVEGKMAEMKNNLLTLEASPVPTDQAKAQERTAKIEQARNALVEAQEAMNPALGEKRYKASGQGPDGKWYEWETDARGREIADTRRPISAAQTGPPKPWRYNTATDTVSDPNTGQSYSPSDPNLPPEAKALLDGARRALAGKSSTTTGEHTIMVWNGTQQVPVQVQTTSTHGAAGLPSLGGGEQPTTHATPAHPAGSATLHSSAALASPAAHPSASHSNAGVVGEGTPVGWKFSPQTTDLTKKADAAAAAQTAVTQEFQTARQQLADLQRDPRNGAAQMALVASYLKNVIGAHSAAQQGAQVRLTNVEWQMALNSQPWLEQYAKHVQGGVVLSGVVLSPAQARNFVGQIGEQAIKAKQTAAELKKQAEASVEKDKGGVGAQPVSAGGFDWNAHPVAQ